MPINLQNIDIDTANKISENIDITIIKESSRNNDTNIGKKILRNIDIAINKNWSSIYWHFLKYQHFLKMFLNYW